MIAVVVLAQPFILVVILVVIFVERVRTAKKSNTDKDYAKDYAKDERAEKDSELRLNTPLPVRVISILNGQGLAVASLGHGGSRPQEQK